MTPKALFRLFAIAEAITWALLLTGMVIKYVLDAGGWGVSIGGGLHGFVFLCYLVVVVFVGVNQRWTIGTMLLGLVSAVIPFATIPFEIVAARRGLLAGPWRRDATDDPRDQNVPNRALRLVLARPVLVASLAAVGVIVVFGALLIVGPPVGGASA
jgi:integral membrane protein